MARLDLLELPIHVWMPMDPANPCLAQIGNLPMIFRAPSPIKARRLADDWRKEERAKALKRDPGLADRLAARGAKASEVAE